MNELAQFYAALADGNRLRLLQLMRRGEVCVCHLQAALQTNQPRISRHLAYLKRAGLVESRRDGKWMHYRLKKLAGARQTLLRETLNHLAKQSLSAADRRRAAQAACRPPERVNNCC